MKTLLRISFSCLATILLPLASQAQLRLEENIDYSDGELNTVSFDQWRIGGTPWAEANNGTILVDHTGERSFDGRYQRLWPTPSSFVNVYASFQLTVEVAPAEENGFNFVAVTNVTGEWNRARLFMKKGRGPDSYRLGISVSSADPDNASFFPADLLLNHTYTIAIVWDNVNLAASLYIDAPNDEAAYRVRISGGTPRTDGFRRFSIYMNSGRDLGRYRIDAIRAGEDWASTWQPFSDKPEPVLDDDIGLLLADDFDYPAGELIAVSGDVWRPSPSTSNPSAQVENGKLVFDTAGANTFAGDYVSLWSIPESTDAVFGGFYLTVNAAPAEPTGFNIASFADRLSPEFQRARVFLKRGEGQGTFRLGLSASESIVTEGGAVTFMDKDLQTGMEYLVLMSWDAINFTARLYLDTTVQAAPLLEAVGESTRELRRFSFRTDSAFDLGRYEVRRLRVAEDWQTLVTTIVPPLEPGFYNDPVLGRHFQAGEGWVLWTGEAGSPDRGVIKLGEGYINGSGWVHHEQTGWMYLVAGGSVDGWFAWSVDRGWIYSNADAAFYSYSQTDYFPWVP